MKKDKWLDIFFWSVIFISWIITFFVALKEDSLTLTLLIDNIKADSTLFPNIIRTGILMFLSQFVILWFLTIPYFSVKYIKRKNKIERSDEYDLKNDEYYREIIPKYSVGVLSYIDDFTIGANDVAATLLSLSLKKCIKIENDDIKISNSKIELMENENYILNCLKKDEIISIREFNNLIKKDAVASKLVKGKIETKKMFEKSIFGTIISILFGRMTLYLCESISRITQNKSFSNPILLLSFCVGVFLSYLYPLFLWGRMIVYWASKTTDPYIRNKKGKELNKKIEGLRKYINDYSTMEDKDKESLTIWEEYLIYSVMFGINKKVAEDILRFVRVE